MIPGLGAAEFRHEDSCKLSLVYSYRHADKLRRGTKREDDLQDQIHVTNLWTRISAGIEYGLTDRFTFTAAVPYNVNVRKEGYRNNEYEAHGLGDVTLSGRYWLFEPGAEAGNF